MSTHHPHETATLQAAHQEGMEAVGLEPVTDDPALFDLDEVAP